MCPENRTPKIMVFRPTWEEFKKFGSYIELMGSKGAHKAGVAKVCNFKNEVFFIKISDFIVITQNIFHKYVIFIL